MAVVSCPKCASGLRVPDGSAAAVRCPKCKTVFTPPAAKPAAPAFEVVEPSPPRTAPKSPPPPAPKSSPGQKKPFSLDDAVRSAEKTPRRPARDDDADDDRRSRSRRDDRDEDEDRPRSRRRDDDYDDADDDRPRGRRGRDDDYDDYDDDYDRPRRKADKKAPFRAGKVAALLLAIGFWGYLAALGVTTLLILIGWLSEGGGNGGILILPGLVGAAALGVTSVGLGFAIAGPAQARGMAIAAAVAGAIHLGLAVFMFSKIHTTLGDFGAFFGGGGGSSPIPWLVFVTTLPILDITPSVLIYSKRGVPSDFYVWLLGAMAEAARFVLTLLALKAACRAARDGDGETRCQLGVLVGGGVIAAAVALTLIVTVILDGSKMAPKTAMNMIMGTLVLIYLGYTLMMLPAALAGMATKDACDART